MTQKKAFLKIIQENVNILVEKKYQSTQLTNTVSVKLLKRNTLEHKTFISLISLFSENKTISNL